MKSTQTLSVCRRLLVVAVVLAGLAVCRTNAAGFYFGNDIGAKGTGESNIEKLLGHDVLQLGLLEDGRKSGNGFAITGFGKSGQWNFSGLDCLVEAITVKAGNWYCVVPVNGNQGIWNTLLLGNKDLSHITFWGSKCPPPRVPEGTAAAGALLALGFGWVMRRQVAR